MVTCVECGKFVSETHKEFKGKGNIRLTKCEHCKKTADKYVETDFVIIFLDLILHRFQVYRHILFNIEYVDQGISLNYVKVFIIYVFFEAYTKWIRLVDILQFQCKQNHSTLNCNEIQIPNERYLIIVLSTITEFFAFVATIVLLVKYSLKPNTEGNKYAIIKYNYLVMAMILSSFGKVFVILMMIWQYDYGFSFLNNLIDLFVFTSNSLALKVFLETSTWRSMSFIALGILAKTLVQLVFTFIDSSFPFWIFGAKKIGDLL